MTFCS